MKATRQRRVQSDNGRKSEKPVYESPAIIYEGTIGTRAGSIPGGGGIDDVDPGDLFGGDEGG